MEINISEMWSLITSFTYQRVASGNIVLGMFFMSLILVCILDKGKKVKSLYGVYSIVFFVTYFGLGIFYYVLWDGVSQWEYYKIFWLLPVIIVIPYFFISCDGVLKTKEHRFCLLLFITMFFVLRGTTAYTLAEESENSYRIPSVVLDIINVINDDALYNDIEIKRVVFSTEIIPFVRQYDASIVVLTNEFPQLLNKENIDINENKQDILKMVNSLYINGLQLERLMRAEGYNYLVIWEHTLGIETLTRSFYQVEMVCDYVVFRIVDYKEFQAIFEGVDYTLVFDYRYYLNNYEDVEAIVGVEPLAVLEHFITVGMPEGRRGRESFDVKFYRENYADLDEAFEDNWIYYYLHYITHGVRERRTTKAGFPKPIYDGEDISPIFNFEFFMLRYPELVKNFEDLDDVFYFFVNEGMNMGLQGAATFDVFYYRENNTDLKEEFGDELGLYYLHFLEEGRFENRRAISGSFIELRNREKSMIGE